MLADNNWYGHRYILSRYLGIKDRNIFGWIQHGWQSQSLQKVNRKLEAKKYPLFFWTKYNKNFYNKT